MSDADDRIWFEFVESKIFSKQVRELAGELVAKIQSDLVQNPQRGDIVKGTHEFGKPASLSRRRHGEKAVATDIFISIWNTLAGFTCCTCSAKANNPICRRSKSGSSEL